MLAPSQKASACWGPQQEDGSAAPAGLQHQLCLPCCVLKVFQFWYLHLPDPACSIAFAINVLSEGTDPFDKVICFPQCHFGKESWQAQLLQLDKSGIEACTAGICEMAAGWGPAAMKSYIHTNLHAALCMRSCSACPPGHGATSNTVVKGCHNTTISAEDIEAAHPPVGHCFCTSPCAAFCLVKHVAAVQSSLPVLCEPGLVHCYTGMHNPIVMRPSYTTLWQCQYPEARRGHDCSGNISVAKPGPISLLATASAAAAARGLVSDKSSTQELTPLGVMPFLCCHRSCQLALLSWPH